MRDHVTDVPHTRVLIWAKTYPELSKSHAETVCTAGCDEQGRPLRLYPVPFRYLPKVSQYGLWEWVDIPLVENPKDPRPESRKLGGDDIRPVRRVDTGKDKSWRERREAIFRDLSWHFDCVDDLRSEQKLTGRSLGMVPVSKVERVYLAARSDDDQRKHEATIAARKAQGELFDFDYKELEFCQHRVKVRWRCNAGCPSHDCSVLDWGLAELGRRYGPDKALARMQELTDLNEYDLRFFMGNFFLHQQSFGIVAMWYPKRKYTAQGHLFTP